MKKTCFDEVDSNCIQAFLKESRDACNRFGVHDLVSMWIFLHFMNRSMSSSFFVRLWSRTWKQSRLHDESLLCCTKEGNLRFGDVRD